MIDRSHELALATRARLLGVATTGKRTIYTAGQVFIDEHGELVASAQSP